MCRLPVDGCRAAVIIALAAAPLVFATPARGEQLASLMSPGPLARAHRSVDGVANCTQCHETGRRVTVGKCLTCHKPIADRIARRFGVHRTADSGAGCATCHTEHVGEAADLRRLDKAAFDHARETGFPLDGVHQATAAKCEACHKTRSFLEAKTACASCHVDPHKGSVGPSCTTCHSTKAPFKAARTSFDHNTAKFPLAGAHATTKCEGCHKTSVFRPTAFTTCASCHKDPHENRFRAACSSCHTTDRWSTRTVEHARTTFPLVGAHAKVACAECHPSGSMTAPVRHDTCTSCHVNVHRESMKGDCKACHTEITFRGAPYDHGAQTRFALDGKHTGIACAKCHTTISPAEVPLARKEVDYRGADRECVACHTAVDPHKGDFGRTCDSCHKTATFSVKGFVHAGAAEFYAGSHQPVPCDKCHVPSRTPTGSGPPHPTTACQSCHRDVHLGQIGGTCEGCHRVDGAAFKAVNFSHERSVFQLTGAHLTTACARCHRTETRAFASGHGTTVTYKPIDMKCQNCHADVHLGQVDTRCETCHQTAAFKLASYTHRGLEDFFAGFHGKYACVACHKPHTGSFPSGRGTTVRFLVGRTCQACHSK